MLKNVLSPNMKNNITSYSNSRTTAPYFDRINKFVYHVRQANLTLTCIQTYAKTEETLNTTQLTPIHI